MSLLNDLDDFPPFMVYAMARKGHGQRGRFLEFVKVSGLSERTFVRIAAMTSWAHVRIDQADAFCRACGADLIRPSGMRHYLGKTLQHGDGAFAHLSPIQKRRLERRLEALMASAGGRRQTEAEQSTNPPQLPLCHPDS